MLTDGIGQVTITNGVLRIELIKVGPSGETIPSGVLEIPQGSVQPVLNGVIESINKLNEQINEQLEESTNEDKSKDKKESKKKNN
tara:strand:+ start:186 stop:440 length:255 start_codon:yes stop_codon:yes gene_type:complete